MPPFFHKIRTIFTSSALKKEWKKTYQLKKDYEALSELARYIDQQLEDLGNDEMIRFFSLGRKGVINDPVFSNLETYLDNGFPDNLKECLLRISDNDFQVFQEHLASRVDNKLDLTKLKYIAFSGGGAKGMSYPGALEALDEIQSPNSDSSLLDNIKETSGASAGALISLPLALGYSPKEIKDIVTQNRYEHFFDDSIVSSEGIRAELTRVLKKTSGGLRRKLAEVEYLDVFTREMNKKMINYMVDMMKDVSREVKGRELTKEEIEQYESSIKSQLLRMTHHELISFCEFLDEQDGVLDKWMKESFNIAQDKVKSSLFNSLTRKYPDFGGFNTSFDAMKFSLRRYYGSDKIEEFMGDIIEDALDKVPEEKLEEVLPSMTIKADQMLLRNVAIVLDKLNRYGLPRLSDAGFPVNQAKGWRNALDEMVIQNEDYHGVWKENKGYHWSDLLKDVKQHRIDRQELNTALSALKSLSDSKLINALDICRKDNLDHYRAGQEIKDMLPDWAFKHQRRLYKRNINFLELSYLADKLPEYGFKKLHVTMCRLDGRVNVGKMLFKHEDFMRDRYKLAMGSHLDNQYSRMPIKLSARISMNLPVGFEKKHYYGESFIDGGVVMNTPNHMFHRKPYYGKNETLTCMLGDNSFFEGGRHIKEAIKGTRIGPVEKIKIAKNPLVAVGKFISWVSYKLNPGYKKFNNDELLRTIFLQTDDVSVGDFGINEEKKIEIIDKAKHDTKRYLNNQEDAQHLFLSKRLETLEASLTNIGRETPSASSVPSLRPGVFSTGIMAKMHEDMVSTSSVRKHVKRRSNAIESQGMSL